MKEFLGKEPRFGEGVFVAKGAVVVGDVELGDWSSVWFNAVVRGDVNSVRVGRFTNIQDCCVLHVTDRLYPLVIGDRVTVGHGAVIHGCTVESMCLIGMGAVLLDGCRIGEGGIVAAGSVVREKMVIPPGKLVAGIPATIVRDVTEKDLEEIRRASENYRYYVENYLALGKGGTVK